MAVSVTTAIELASPAAATGAAAVFAAAPAAPAAPATAAVLLGGPNAEGRLAGVPVLCRRVSVEGGGRDELRCTEWDVSSKGVNTGRYPL